MFSYVLQYCVADWFVQGCMFCLIYRRSIVLHWILFIFTLWSVHCQIVFTSRCHFGVQRLLISNVPWCLSHTWSVQHMAVLSIVIARYSTQYKRSSWVELAWTCVLYRLLEIVTDPSIIHVLAPVTGMVTTHAENLLRALLGCWALFLMLSFVWEHSI